MTKYEVYANGFPEGSLFKVTDCPTLDESINYALKLLEMNSRSFVTTVHTQVRQVTTEVVWDNKPKGAK